MALYLGLDIGGTKTAGGLVTDAGQVVLRREWPTPAREGGPAVLSNAIHLARTLQKESEGLIAGIGIGAGGQVDARRGVIVSATSLLPEWAGTPVKATFEEAFGLPTAVDNDVNALAVGEGRFGEAVGLATVVFLALGTGVGGALLLNGRLHHGAHWSGGEFGHILLTTAPDARHDAGGHHGTLEAYVSGPGLVANWRELVGANDASERERDTPRITGQAIVEMATHDPGGVAARAITYTGEMLGYGLVSLANALDPDIIVIGGGLAALGDRLLEPARRVLRTQSLPGPATCPVVLAARGPEAAIIGAASLGMPSLPEP